MIKPTVGRIVHYRPGPSDVGSISFLKGAKLAAMIVAVEDEGFVNLRVFDRAGNAAGRMGVPLIQEGELKPHDGRYCEWMPHQVEQSERAEGAREAEKLVADDEAKIRDTAFVTIVDPSGRKFDLTIGPCARCSAPIEPSMVSLTIGDVLTTGWEVSKAPPEGVTAASEEVRERAAITAQWPNVGIFQDNAKRKQFESELTALLNRWSVDAECNIPDFKLAGYAIDSMLAAKVLAAKLKGWQPASLPNAHENH